MDATHLVLEALGDTDNYVVDDGLDGANGSDLFAVAVDDSDLDLVVVDLVEGDVNVTKVVLQGATGTGDGHLAGLDLDSDVLGDVKNLVLLDETHLV